MLSAQHATKLNQRMDPNRLGGLENENRGTDKYLIFFTLRNSLLLLRLNILFT